MVEVGEDCFYRPARVGFGVLGAVKTLHQAEQGAHQSGALARIVGDMHLPAGNDGPGHGFDPASLLLHRHLMKDKARDDLGEGVARAVRVTREPPPPRSEEHTSELQSLMRPSSAVFCLKKNNTTHKQL